MQQSSQNGLTTRSVFNIRNNKLELALTANPIYGPNEQTTSSSIEFYLKIGQLLNQFNDLDWQNILLAGGIISGLLEKKYDPELYKDSDLDFFVYGKNVELVRITSEKLYNYFKSKFETMYSFIYENSMVITILTPEFSRSIQIIGTNKKTAIDIIKEFDLTHCQVGFDGEKLVYTDDFIDAMATHVTKINSSSIHAYRLVKAHKRGFSIKRAPKLYIKNFFHSYIVDDETKLWKNTDKYWDINKLDEQFEELSNNETVLLNLNKNYVPSIEETNDEVLDNIKKYYPEQMITIIDNSKPILSYINRSNAYINVFK